MTGWIRQYGVARGWGNCLKYLKRGLNRKEGRETTILKWGKGGLRGGCLKKLGAGTHLRSVIHAVNSLLECIERNTLFKIVGQFKSFNNSLKLCENRETLV